MADEPQGSSSVKISASTYARVKAYRDTLPYAPQISRVLDGLIETALNQIEEGYAKTPEVIPSEPDLEKDTVRPSRPRRKPRSGDRV